MAVCVQRMKGEATFPRPVPPSVPTPSAPPPLRCNGRDGGIGERTSRAVVGECLLLVCAGAVSSRQLRRASCRRKTSRLGAVLQASAVHRCVEPAAVDETWQPPQPPRRQGARARFAADISLEEARQAAAVHDLGIRELQDPENRLIFLAAGPEALFKHGDRLTRREALIRRDMYGGLVFDATTGELLSRRYHKFFHLGENSESLPWSVNFRRQHVVLEKLDGVLMSPLLLPRGELRLSTKSGLSTKQALCAERHAFEADAWTRRRNHGPTPAYDDFCRLWLRRKCTPLFEWIDPNARVTVAYNREQLVLTAIRHTPSGEYVGFAELMGAAADYNIPCVGVLATSAEHSSASSSDALCEEDDRPLLDADDDPDADEDVYAAVGAASSSTSSTTSSTSSGRTLRRRGVAARRLMARIEQLPDIEGAVVRFDDGLMFKLGSDWWRGAFQARQFSSMGGVLHAWRAALQADSLWAVGYTSQLKDDAQRSFFAFKEEVDAAIEKTALRVAAKALAQDYSDDGSGRTAEKKEPREWAAMAALVRDEGLDAEDAVRHVLLEGLDTWYRRRSKRRKSKVSGMENHLRWVIGASADDLTSSAGGGALSTGSGALLSIRAPRGRPSPDAKTASDAEVPAQISSEEAAAVATEPSVGTSPAFLDGVLPPALDCFVGETLVVSPTAEDMQRAREFLLRDDLELQVLGFDTEWNGRGPRHKIAPIGAMQFASADRALVVQGVAAVPTDVACATVGAFIDELLQRPGVVLVGWDLRADRRALANHLGVQVADARATVVDLLDAYRVNDVTKLEPHLRGFKGTLFRLGAKPLKAYAMTLSDWSAAGFSTDQVTYAAEDAWWSLWLFAKTLQDANNMPMSAWDLVPAPMTAALRLWLDASSPLLESTRGSCKNPLREDCLRLRELLHRELLDTSNGEVDEWELWTRPDVYAAVQEAHPLLRRVGDPRNQGQSFVRRWYNEFYDMNRDLFAVSKRLGTRFVRLTTG